MVPIDDEGLDTTDGTYGIPEGHDSHGSEVGIYCVPKLGNPEYSGEFWPKEDARLDTPDPDADKLSSYDAVG